MNVQRMEENRVPKEYCIRIWKQQDQKVDQEVDDKMK
jgi:hypothetical protein